MVMDIGGSDSNTGVEPKFFDPWETSNQIPSLSWNSYDLEHPPELDTTCQDSNEGDAEQTELTSASDPPSRDSVDVPIQEVANVTAGIPKGVNFVGGTFSPQTNPFSGDDVSQPDATWAQLQLPNPMGLARPHESLYFGSSFGKETAKASEAVIVDETDDRKSRLENTTYQPDTVSEYRRLEQSAAAYGSDNWCAATPQTTLFPTQQLPISPPLEPKSENDGSEEPTTTATANSPWLTELTMPMTPNLITSFSQNMKPEDQENTAQSQNTPQGSPVHGNGTAGFNITWSADTGNIKTEFSDSEVKDEVPWAPDWGQSSTSTSSNASPVIPKVSAFMVSQDSSDMSLTTATSAWSPPHHGGVTHIPSACQPASMARKRRQRNSIMGVEQPTQPKPLQIVQEDGMGGSISSEDFVAPPRGARRKGPLSIQSRVNAGARRKNKDTCVQCRLSKRKCDGQSPCDPCRPTLHEQPCARACFSNIVEFGTCNYISQRAINHITVNGKNRVRMEIPSAFDVKDLVTLLETRRGKFNIRASQSWGSLYVLDLGEAYKFLKSFSECNDASQCNFLEFVDRRIIESKDKSKNWLRCVKDCDPMNNVYALLSQWNNMPSRATYSFVPVDGSGEDRIMDTSNPDDRKEILLAAQLSRIFCRMLEVEGFRKLERDFYNIKWKRISLEAHIRFLSELGRILLTLRWRVSWWKRLGDGGVEPDPSQQHYVDRVHLLCRILYVYYTNVMAKLPSWSMSDVPKGIWSTYADAEEAVWDDFPLDPTEKGFQQWLDKGQELIEKAGVPKRLSTTITRA